MQLTMYGLKTKGAAPEAQTVDLCVTQHRRDPIVGLPRHKDHQRNNLRLDHLTRDVVLNWPRMSEQSNVCGGLLRRIEFKRPHPSCSSGPRLAEPAAQDGSPGQRVWKALHQ
eukprot:9225018-Lingulodinium_polyedra.AAC.1